MSLLDGLNLATKRNTTRIIEYETLEHYVAAWSEGKGHRAMVIIGRPGILKSSVIKTAFPKGEGLLHIEGSTGPLALYRDLYLNLDKAVVLDDVKITEPLSPILLSLWDNYV